MCTILVVDDEEDVLELAQTHLSVLGHEVHSASNGEEALHFLAEHEGDPPCMILTDLRMPILDGWDLMNALKRDHRWANLPVIVCSGSIHPDAPPPVLKAKAYWSRRPSKQALDHIHEHCLRHHQSWPPLAGETAETEAAG
jgi:CheY-like chemotaxis protein